MVYLLHRLYGVDAPGLTQLLVTYLLTCLVTYLLTTKGLRRSRLGNVNTVASGDVRAKMALVAHRRQLIA